ncbi:MAG TPA: glycosyltransferase family A protein [Pseudonocardiaceae bacterium]
MPLLSVLTAAHGERADFLAEAGASLAGQELPAGWELEWIVQYDGPEPKLADTVSSFPFARYAAHGERLGAAMTRNLGLTRVGGELVHVLDSDDLILPGGLRAAVEAFAAYPWIHWVAGQADDLLPDGTRVAFEPRLPPGLIEPGALNELVAEHDPLPVHPAGLTLRTATTRALGGWAANPRADDNSLMVAVAEITAGYLTPEVTWLYRKHEGQITGLPYFSALEPIAWTVVRQRISALRETGLRLGS